MPLVVDEASLGGRTAAGVSAFARNRCPRSAGFSVRDRPELVSGIDRITHRADRRGHRGWMVQ